MEEIPGLRTAPRDRFLIMFSNVTSRHGNLEDLVVAASGLDIAVVPRLRSLVVVVRLSCLYLVFHLLLCS